MTILSFDIEDLPEAHEDALRALLREAYRRDVTSDDDDDEDEEDDDGDDDGDEEPFRVFLMVEEGGAVVGGLLAYKRTATANGVPFGLGLIGTVATRKSHRRQGIATRLVLAAHDYFRGKGVRFSVLFAFDPDVYRGMGYREIEGSLTYRNGASAVTERVKGSMVCPLADEAWPEGAVDLRGGLV